MRWPTRIFSSCPVSSQRSSRTRLIPSFRFRGRTRPHKIWDNLPSLPIIAIHLIRWVPLRMDNFPKMRTLQLSLSRTTLRWPNSTEPRATTSLPFSTTWRWRRSILKTGQAGLLSVTATYYQMTSIKLSMLTSKLFTALRTSETLSCGMVSESCMRNLSLMITQSPPSSLSSECLLTSSRSLSCCINWVWYWLRPTNLIRLSDTFRIQASSVTFRWSVVSTPSWKSESFMSFKVTLSKPRIHTRSPSLTTKTIIKSINISLGAPSKKGKSLKPSTTLRRLTPSQRTTSTVYTSKAVATSSSESSMRLTIASKLLKVIRQLMRSSGLRFQFCFTISKSTRTPFTP